MTSLDYICTVCNKARFPIDKFEHVVLHELTHLTVKNHSRAFWEQLNEYDKNWRENNRWLKKEAVKRFIV